ncbi:tape measure protein [Acinetobacter sp. NyZ410]|uniref:tape measure protein n=1 Tax=Acinetobacter sp. NyZ410 TaxID=2929509 RepID=UPI001FB89996|nr:tape measure protein [Acinetobacter sp. NyZ410]UOH17170.1 tape measure protein [Acinetobacter sp. NyZ410]
MTVGTAIAKMDTYTGLNNKLKLVTKSQSELNTAMNDTFKIAQNTAQAWDSVAQIYQRFSDNAQRLNITQAKTAELTDTVAKAIAISGGSAASAEAALVQFSQALASNVLRGEELNSVMEQAPGLAKAIAQGMGITVGQLRSVAAEGKITGDVLVDALTKARGSVNELFGKTDFTIAQSFTQLSNAVTKFVGEAGKGSGAASAISSSLSSLANNLDTVTNIAMIGGAYWLGTYIPALYKSVAAQQTRITTLVSEVRAEQLANEITAQRTARIAHLSTIELANAEAQLARMTGMARIAYLEKTVLPLRQANTAALQADTIAQNANNASKSLATRAGTSLIGVLGGPVGLGLTVAAVGASMLLMGDNTESATNSLENQKNTVSELTAEYGKLSTAKLVSEMDEIDKRVSAAESKISKSKNGLLGMVAGNSDSISNEEIKRQNLILDQLKKIEKEGLSTASALQAIDASKLFTDGEIKQAQKFFAKMEEGNNELARGTAQRQLANSALDKASGIYENLAKESSNLTLEQERLTSSLESAKSGFSFVSDSLLQSAANAGVSKDGIEQLKKSINAYSAGALSATALLKEFQKYIPIKESDLKSYLQIANNVEAQQKALTLNEIQLKKNKSIQDGLNKSLSDSNVTGANFNKVLEDGTKKAVATSESVKGLSVEIQKFINQSLSDISTNSEILALRAKGISKEVAENYVKLKEAQGLLGKNQPIDTGAFSLMMADLSIKQKIKDLDDLQAKSEKDRTKELEKQLKVLQVNEKVKANAAKYGFENIESKYAILPGLLSGIHMQESRGNANAIGPMTKYGTAKGGFQFLDDTAKRFKLTGGDVFDLGKSAEAAAKYLQILYKKFGSWDKAISAYHAGEGNVDKGTNIGPVNRQYVQNVKGYIAGTNGFDGSTKDFDNSINDLVKFLQAKQDIELQYSSGEIQRKTEHEKKLADIQSYFTGEALAKFEQKENERFANENRLAELQFDLQVNGWKWTNEQRIQNEIDTQKVTISLNKEYSDIQKQIAKEEVDEKFAYELEKSKLAKNQRLLQATEFYMSELQLAKARYDIEKKLIAQSNEDPKEKAFKSQMLELQNQVDMNRRLKDASMGWDSVQSQMNGSTGRYQVNQDRFSRMGASQNLFDTQIADVENQEQEPGADLQKLAEVREQIWAAHNQRMIDIENQYQTDSLNLQLTQAQQLTGSFANMFKGILGESSGAYKTMFAMQQGFALTQAGMNLWSSVSDAYAKEPGTVWQKVAAGAKAALDQGTFLAMIQAITPQGFATGGHITGKGTGTSDDIPIMASNGEFMMKASAVSKLGLSALNYMNQTGEIPFQREYLGMKSHHLGSTQPDLNAQKFKNGGLVGVSRISGDDVDRRQFQSIQHNSPRSSEPNIIIQVSITDSGVNTSGGNTQDQRQFAQVVGNAVRAVIIQEKRQGGLLSK